MPVWIAVAIGGASGSLARYALGLCARTAVPGFPLATLIVNGVGGVCIGLIFALTAARPDTPEWLRTGLITGVLGGFTTFSAFSLETLLLWREGQGALAFANIALNLLLSLGGCALGLWLGRSL
ncbi:MAG: fluoride efflux transporter CrcB [Hydrogenophaga sp.]|nr:fluoride efflux transporter CrcB [Hydrogenophaga sp.]